MSDRPISATELLTKIRRMIFDEIECDTERLVEKLSGIQWDEPDNRLTLEGAVSLGARINGYQDLLNDLRNEFKHADLQCWGDDEVSPQE